MSIYVFLGPTLPVADARLILDATYLPPASSGDIVRVMTDQPQAIAIIDGVFQREPAVWHKEILFALSRGVRVFGSSGLGALRAAELHTFGMEGVGRIFEAYRDGLLEDDDEVVVTHAGAQSGYGPTSEAMINIRDGLSQAERRALIAPETHRVLLDEAKRIFYPERSWRKLLKRGAMLSLPAHELTALKLFVRRQRPDIKRADAIELLRSIAEQRTPEMVPHKPTFYLELTETWRILIERTLDTQALPMED